MVSVVSAARAGAAHRATPDRNKAAACIDIFIPHPPLRRSIADASPVWSGRRSPALRLHQPHPCLTGSPARRDCWPEDGRLAKPAPPYRSLGDVDLHGRRSASQHPIPTTCPRSTPLCPGVYWSAAADARTNALCKFAQVTPCRRADHVIPNTLATSRPASGNIHSGLRSRRTPSRLPPQGTTWTCTPRLRMPAFSSPFSDR